MSKAMSQVVAQAKIATAEIAAEKKKKADAAAAASRSRQIAKEKTETKTHVKKSEGGSKTVKSHVVNQVTHVPIPAYRPQRGLELYSYTRAFLELSGLMSGGAISRSFARTAMGATAVNHHLNSTRYFEDAAEGLKLTISGLSHFTNRNVIKSQVEAYMQVLQGTPSDKTQVRSIDRMLAV